MHISVLCDLTQRDKVISNVRPVNEARARANCDELSGCGNEFGPQRRVNPELVCIFFFAVCVCDAVRVSQLLATTLLESIIEWATNSDLRYCPTHSYRLTHSPPPTLNVRTVNCISIFV